MSVTVHREPPGLGDAVPCERCQRPTRTWWHHVLPMCVECARASSLAGLIGISVVLGYPVPVRSVKSLRAWLALEKGEPCAS